MGVVNHMGGLGGGHYTAYAQLHTTSEWHCFDDSRVSRVFDPEREVVSPAAYLIIYRRRHERDLDRT